MFMLFVKIHLIQIKEENGTGELARREEMPQKTLLFGKKK